MLAVQALTAQPCQLSRLPAQKASTALAMPLTSTPSVPTVHIVESQLASQATAQLATSARATRPTSTSTQDVSLAERVSTAMLAQTLARLATMASSATRLPSSQIQELRPRVATSVHQALTVLQAQLCPSLVHLVNTQIKKAMASQISVSTALPITSLLMLVPPLVSSAKVLRSLRKAQLAAAAKD